METKTAKQISIENATNILLIAIGEDHKRPGLIETPKRVAKAWMEMTSGYSKDASKILKCFEDGAENYDSMILVKDIPFYSFCEHHMIPFFGTVTIGYIPKGRILGLSKFSRVVDIFSKRLQVQERLTTQISDAINNSLEPLGVGVVIKARHLCMEARGVCQQGHHTVTQSLKGVMLNEEMARNEFLTLAR